MTNTKIPHTVHGIVCGKCSSGFGKERVVVRHAGVAEVKACFSLPLAPVVEVPAPAPVLAEPKVIDYTPKTFKRYMAACRVKGCTEHAVEDGKFLFVCPTHKWVRVWAKQLVGKLSKSAKHACNDACLYAKGPTCVCSCGGAGHGTGYLVTVANV